MLKEAGFKESYSGDITDVEEIGGSGVHIYETDEYPPKIIFVELWNESSEIGRFFVRQEFVTMFYATWLPEFKARRSTCIIADEMIKIRQALIAFIRHGKGRDTIDVYGQTLDDREMWHERSMELRRQKAEKAAKERKAAEEQTR